ncbi:MAG: hypothetical protein JWN41_1104 [Thermoleophilia bacterium]|nr:hypothetical protein [Thermoleophilia bacterium]
MRRPGDGASAHQRGMSVVLQVLTVPGFVNHRVAFAQAPAGVPAPHE